MSVLAYDVRDRVSPQGDSHTQGDGLFYRLRSSSVCHALRRAARRGIYRVCSSGMVAQQRVAAELRRAHANTLVALPHGICPRLSCRHHHRRHSVVARGYSKSCREHQDGIRNLEF